jgi:hypothetical protein
MLRVPATGVVAEMDAGFEQLAHGEIGHRHWRAPFLVVRLSLRGALPCGTGSPFGRKGARVRITRHERQARARWRNPAPVKPIALDQGA